MTVAYRDRAYVAVVSQRPTWRVPVPPRRKSRSYRTSAAGARSAHRSLVRSGAPEELARDLAEAAEERIGRWVSGGGFRAKIRETTVTVRIQ